LRLAAINCPVLCVSIPPPLDVLLSIFYQLRTKLATNAPFVRHEKLEAVSVGLVIAGEML